MGLLPTAEGMTLGYRAACGIAAAIFVYAFVVQLNDVDPLRWMLIYGAAAAVSLQRALGDTSGHGVSLLVAVSALAWALALLPQARGADGMAAVELWREIGGLLVVGVWMGWTWKRVIRIRKGEAA